jgi:ribose transport system permease protein
MALVIASGVAALVHLGLSRSLAGRWLYAIGHNRRTAEVSGVPFAGVTIGAYIASGVCAAVAAVLYTGQAEAGSPVLGHRILLDVIGATVIGGASLFGGKGKVLWTLWGVLFFKLIDNSLNLLNLSVFTITMVKGTVILGAAVLDATRQRLAAGIRA